MVADQQEVFVIKPAVRHAVPQSVAIIGPTFSGKTYGALLLAAGMVKPGEKIGFIDTEHGRGSMYADDPDIRAAIKRESWFSADAPYGVIEIDPPFHPQRYIAAIRTFDAAGVSLVITDSGSHAWNGTGGGLDMKEGDKSWVKAKLWSKRFMHEIIYSRMHHIICLRAQEKTKIVGTGKAQEYIPLGIAPICEKTFTFDLSLTFQVEGEIENKPATHLAWPMKWPKAMNPMFANWTKQLLTPSIGQRIREWNDSAPVEDATVRLTRQSQIAALEGLESYQAWFTGQRPGARKVLIDTGTHAANKVTAAGVRLEDDDATEQPQEEIDAALAAKFERDQREGKV